MGKGGGSHTYTLHINKADKIKNKKHIVASSTWNRYASDSTDTAMGQCLAYSGKSKERND